MIEYYYRLAKLTTFCLRLLLHDSTKVWMLYHVEKCQYIYKNTKARKIRIKLCFSQKDDCGAVKL